MAPVEQFPEHGAEWRLVQLQNEYTRLTWEARKVGSDKDAIMDEMELILSLIRKERRRLGLPNPVKRFDWNEAVFYCFVVVFAVSFVMGVAALMFGGWE